MLKIALLLGLAGPLAGAEPHSPVVALPPFPVQDTRVLPPPEHWDYGRVGSFEFLSHASAARTIRIANTLEQFRAAIAVAWSTLTLTMDRCNLVIVCGSSKEFESFRPTGPGLARPHAVAAASFGLWNANDAVWVVNGDFDAPDSVLLRQVRRDYLHFAMGREHPPPPVWMEEAVSQLLLEMKTSGGQIAFGAPDNLLKVLQQSEEKRAKGAAVHFAPGTGSWNSFLAFFPLMPLGQMFTVTREQADAGVMGFWPDQCAGFLHYCLFADDGIHRRQAMDFIARTAAAPVSEAIFADCFHESYAEMQAALKRYALEPRTRYAVYPAYLAELAPPADGSAFHRATQSQVGRIKGLALGLAGHDAEGHQQLIAPYFRGERDPELLAVLGLDELARRQPDRAARFLEAAVAGGTHEVAAYTELGHLELQGRKDDCLLPADFHRLWTGLAQLRGNFATPAEFYEVAAEVLIHSPEKLTADQMATIAEGLDRHPQDLRLIYLGAVLMARSGDVAGGSALAERGLTTVTGPKDRSRFARLTAALAVGDVP